MNDKRNREVADQIIRSRIIKDHRQVDTGKWAIPEDSHLLRTPSAFRDDVIALFADQSCKGDRMPASKTHDYLRFRPSEVSIWLGFHESYKSTFLNELAAYWAVSGIGVAIASLEMPAPILLHKTVMQVLAKTDPGVPRIDDALEVLSEKLTIYDVTGRVPPNHLISVMRYCALELGVRHFVLDNLTMILSVDNERAAEHQAFVANCVTVARTTGLHIHLVAHSNKPAGGDESKMPGPYDARGTGSAPDMADNVMVCFRNKVKEDKIDQGKADDDTYKEPDFILRVAKQRHWGYRGYINYWLDRRVLRFHQYGTDEVTAML